MSSVCGLGPAPGRDENHQMIAINATATRSAPTRAAREATRAEPDSASVHIQDDGSATPRGYDA